MGKFLYPKDVNLASAKMDLLNVRDLTLKKIVRNCLVLQTKELLKKESAVQSAEVNICQ